MKLIQTAIVIMGALLGACVVSYFSGFISVHEDVSTKETVGITHFNGFPIWFYEQAPGISVFSAWHFERFMWNTVLWAVLFSVFVFWIWRSCRITKPR